MLDLESLNRFRDFKFQILKLIPEWAQVYQVSQEAVMRQIQWAHAWCNANPRKAPKKDPVRFLGNWMRIAKQMGTLVSHPRETAYREEKPSEEELPGPEEFKKFREAIKHEAL